MALRPARTKKSAGKSSLRAARANIRGYAARQARKEQASDSLDVYEYSTGRVRRSKIGLALDREEEIARGKGSDGEDEDVDDAREKLRLRIANADEDGVVESDEDEEIDSDAAFEESDEERFANFKFGGSVKSKAKIKRPDKIPKVSFAKEINLDEDSEEDEAPTPKPMAQDSERDESEDEDAESDEESEEEEEEDLGSTIELSQMLQGADDHSESESDSGSDAESESPSVDQDDPEANSKLVDFISNLDTSKKRKLADGSTDRAAKKRAFVSDQTEAGPEGEFGAKSGPQPLSLDDLLAPAASLAQSTKALQSTTKSALTAPLPKRTQDRLDREAAYATTKEEVQKWAPTMKRIREAEHLAFPLQGPNAGKPRGISNADIVDRFQPTTPMESAISALLRAANLHTDAAAAEAEATLAAATISEEELAARRAQLRATRELMFRADLKAKRVAKIKSKAYRRMKKKEKEKQGEMATELGLDQPADADEERIKAEALRAKERATLRHRTTGKWARAMRDKGEMGEDEVEAIKTLQDRSEILRRKIIEGDESSDDDENGEQRDVQELERMIHVDEIPEKAKGIMAMKFMRDAVAREDREAGAMADEVRLEMLGLEVDSEAANMGDEMVGGNVGRRIYKPGQVQLPPAYSDVSSTLKSSDSNSSPEDTPNSLPPIPSRSPPPSNIPGDITPTESNPWLTVTSTTGKISRKSNIGQTTKVQKVQAKGEEARARAKEDAVVEIDMDQLMVLPESEKKSSRADKGPSTSKGKAAQVDPAYAPSEDEASETDERAPAAFKQRELVAMAFAGDNVVEDFEREKQRVIEEDAPKEVDTTLPGWGSWGGRGTKKQGSRQNLVKKIAGVDASKRADSGKRNIIISERKDKKAAKYLVKDLPYPYTSREQFARSMATPIGTEWNTRVAHQRATLPRVVKKMGTAIDPLERMF